MTITADAAPAAGALDGKVVAAYLAGVLSAMGALAAGTAGVDDAARVDRISLLEKIKAAAAAAQAAEIVAFARSQVDQQREAGVDYRRLGKGIADQVALASGTSGWHGSRKLTLARDLVLDLPRTFGLLAAGGISEYVAQLVANETSHLEPEVRRTLDQQLVDQHLDECSPKQAAALARRLAQTADPAGAVKRAAQARAERHVSLRPAPDTMCWFSALLPVEDGVRCYAALVRQTDAAKAGGDERSRGQIMADSTVARLTGQAPTDLRPVELNLTVPLEHLLDPDSQAPGDVSGFGPVPAGVVDDILSRAGDQVWWRRLFTAPARDGSGRVIVAGDPTARRFTGWLAKLIRLRDGGLCREPYCGAPIRHLDHITPWREGGATSYANGRGMCERHNQVRELPGWTAEIRGVGRDGIPLRVATTTPTGHTYLSRAPNPP